MTAGRSYRFGRLERLGLRSVGVFATSNIGKEL
jgi:hypothetical protein